MNMNDRDGPSARFENNYSGSPTYVTKFETPAGDRIESGESLELKKAEPQWSRLLIYALI